MDMARGLLSLVMALLMFMLSRRTMDMATQSLEYGYNIHKRSAESGYGYGHGYGSAYVHVEQKDHGYGYPESYEYGYNIHKRSAEPGYGSNESYQEVSNTPYSHYDIKVHHPY